MSKDLDEAIEKMGSLPPLKDLEGLKGRAGIFEVPDCLLEGDGKGALEFAELFMSRVFVVRCEPDYMKGTFVYHGYSPEFERLKEGESAPKYKLEFLREPDGNAKFIRALRVKGGF